MDGGAWWAAVHEVAKNWTRLSDFPFTFHFHALEKEMATHSTFLKNLLTVSPKRVNLSQNTEVLSSCQIIYMQKLGKRQIRSTHFNENVGLPWWLRQ